MEERHHMRRAAAVMKRLGSLALVGLLLVWVRPFASGAAAGSGRGGGRSRPNVVIIMSDDQRWDTATPQFMPALNADLVPSGITYTNSFVPDPLCCPSRASTLTGNYSSTTGVWANDGAFGGFDGFNAHGNADHTIATDFHAAGYRTGLFGKYMNGYPEGHYGYVAPGWDTWFALGTGWYYDYHAADDGAKSPAYGSDPASYSGRVLTNEAKAFIQDVPGGRPFLMYLAYEGPHATSPRTQPATPDPRDLGRFGLVWPNGRPPSYEEADISDKPAYIRESAAKWRASPTDALHVSQEDATYSLDRSIGQIWDALPDDTYVLFVSDNGFLWGEHYWQGKFVPYSESARVPTVLAYKGPAPTIAVGTTDPRLVLNVDYLPTLESLAGVTPIPGHTVEGQSFLTQVRTAFPIGLESEHGLVSTYCGVRSATSMYVRYTTGEEELYDEIADPFELVNRVGDAGAAAQLAAMRAQAQTMCTQGQLYPPDWPFAPG
jgi:N-acetylglucosamine-6-sulfatase